MTTAMTTTTNAGALVSVDFDELERATDRLAGSYLMPKHLQGKPDDVFATLMMGRELGLSYTASINGIYVVHGKPAPYSATMVALVKSSPACSYWRVVEADHESATIETLRQGSPEPERVTFTMGDAKRAGYTSNKKYQTNPAEMLTHKAGAILARRVYPDVLHGLHTVEELQLEPQVFEAKTDVAKPVQGKVSLSAPTTDDEPDDDDAVDAEYEERPTPDEPDDDTRYRATFRVACSKCLDEAQLETVEDWIALAPVPDLRALAREIKALDTADRGKAILSAAKEWRADR